MSKHLVIITDPDAYIKEHPDVKIQGIYLTTLKPGSLFCENCGEVFTYFKPCSISMANEVETGFIKLHKDCKLKA